MNENSLVEARNKRYTKYVEQVTPKTAAIRSLWHAFWVGGLICMIGEGFADIYALAFPKLDTEMIASFTSMTLVAIAILLTGLGLYDSIGRFAGAGAFLPITGFANAMASASMEFKTEGLIFGTSVKMFTVVGPVVVNGIVWSTVAAILMTLIG